MREKEDVANAGRIRQQHDQAVDADADTGCWRHPKLECHDVILIKMHGFFVSRFCLLHLAGEIDHLERAISIVEHKAFDNTQMVPSKSRLRLKTPLVTV